MVNQAENRGKNFQFLRGLALAAGILFLTACGSAASASSEIQLDESAIPVAAPADAVEFFNEETSTANDRRPEDNDEVLDLEDFRVPDAESVTQPAPDVATENPVSGQEPVETSAPAIEIVETESAAVPQPIVHPKVRSSLTSNADNELIAEVSIEGCNNGRDYRLVLYRFETQQRERINIDCEAVGSYHVQRALGKVNKTSDVAVRIGIVDVELNERVVNERQETTIEVESLNPIPVDSGTGRRIVYDRRNPSSANVYKVWLVDSVNGEDVVEAFYEVRGNPRSPFAGEYEVTTRSTHALSGERQASGNYEWQSNNMVRFIEPGQQGNTLGIGFHGIPFNPDDPSQQLAGPNDLTEHESAGCIRQNNEDAIKLWNFVNDSFTTTSARTHFSNGNSTPVIVLG